MIARVFVVISSLLAVSAFMAPAARQVSSIVMSERSAALPFDKRPEGLDGTLPGDAGFDPAGFTNKLPRSWLIGGEESSLKWYREAEIVHGRIAQLAVLGNLFPALAHFAGNPAIGVPADAFANMNPFGALSSVPSTGLWHIASFIAFVEINRIGRVIRGDKQPGDLGLGQTGWNPFGFKYTEAEYFEKQVQEIKHGRLAMFGAIGILLQAKASGLGVTEQLGSAFAFPSEREILVGGGNLNDFFPPNL